MANRIQQAQTGEPRWVTDALVWRTIHYLDSITNYREYLPHAHRPAAPEQSEFVTLDDVSRSIWEKLQTLTLITLIAIPICTILLVVLRS